MGACCSSSLSPEEEREIAQSKKYDELIDEKSKEESRVIKLLLLGTTLFPGLSARTARVAHLSALCIYRHGREWQVNHLQTGM
jgi:hypothetical protein